MLIENPSYTFLVVLTADLLATSGDFAITWTSPVLPKLFSNDSTINPLNRSITDDEESWIGSLLNIGAMIGPFPFAYLANRFGRKIALLAIAIPHIISYTILAFAKSVFWFCFARVLGGISLGGGYTLLPMYIAEIAKITNRGSLSVTLYIFWTFGNLISTTVGAYASILLFNLILASVPAIFFVLFSFIAPESPYYLVEQQKITEAEECLLKLRNNDKQMVKHELKEIQLLIEKEKSEIKASFIDLFKTKSCLKALTISLFLITAQQFSGLNALTFYSQEIFTQAGVTDIPPELCTIIVGFVCFLCTFIVPFVADRVGRRTLLMISCLGTSLALNLLGCFFYFKFNLKSDLSQFLWLPLVSLIMYVIFFILGFGPLPWTLASELFPTNLKSFAAGLVSFACWASSFIVTKFFNDFIRILGQAGTFWLFSGCCFLSFVFVIYFVPETKGKSFKEIQEYLEKR